MSQWNETFSRSEAQRESAKQPTRGQVGQAHVRTRSTSKCNGCTTRWRRLCIATFARCQRHSQWAGGWLPARCAPQSALGARACLSAGEHGFVVVVVVEPTLEQTGDRLGRDCVRKSVARAFAPAELAAVELVRHWHWLVGDG